jgi:two-component system, OmpR family, phosphate regulon response regulator OmpR
MAEMSQALPLAGCKILLADDDAEDRYLLKLILERAGAIVEAYPDGEKAIAATNRRGRFAYDVMLLDLMMPGKSGLETAAALRINGFPGKIIGISAFLTPGVSAYLRAAGCDLVLPKGLPPRDLVEAVAATCESSGESISELQKILDPRD